MQNSPGTLQLRPQEWERLRMLVDRFEEAWKRQNNVDLADYLPQPRDPLRPAVLRELLRTDLEIRHRTGRPIDLLDYLRRFPELVEVPLNLLLDDFRLRGRFGKPASLDEYRLRFPNQFQEFERLVVQGAPPTGRIPIPPVIVEDQQPAESRPAVDVLPMNDGYQLVKVIGSGTFGEVWEALAPGEVPAAIKIIHRTLDSEEVQRERRALLIIREMDHPNLLAVTAFWALHDRLVIAMELASGSLRGRLRECRKQDRKGIPRGELLKYMRESASAIDYLHAKSVLHRDVKPDNILLRGGVAKLGDFGLFRDQKPRTPFTILHQPIGTPPYMAPEAWACATVAASDQYALACTYVELRCGRRPFPQKTASLLEVAHIQDTPDLSDLDHAEQQVIYRALAKKPEERFASCLEMVRALESAPALPGSGEIDPSVATPDSLASEKTSPLSTISRPNDRRATKERSQALMWIIIWLCCIAGLAALLYFFWPWKAPLPVATPGIDQSCPFHTSEIALYVPASQREAVA